MKGFVPTPQPIVDLMVAKLFRGSSPGAESSVLDPGCGPGAFIEGVVRWCAAQRVPLPKVVGMESNPQHVAHASSKFEGTPSVAIVHRDFLSPSAHRFDFIVGNPPYVPITKLSEREKQQYRSAYTTAIGRFDLYLLFFEQAIRMLRPGGRLVFITPEKFAYVDTAAPLRRLLAGLQVEELQLVDEQTFGSLVTYPTITTVVNSPPRSPTRVILRDGSARRVRLPTAGTSWLPDLVGKPGTRQAHTLGDACLRISCGVATGADSVYVVPTSALSPALRKFAYPTIAGREIAAGKAPTAAHSMLVPYTTDGELLRERDLGPLGGYLRERHRRQRLLKRTCVARKPWYAFHENPPLRDLLRPKILCKDISSRPFFVVDQPGRLVPRHSVYYLVPRDPSRIAEIADYLNSERARNWLSANCQRAANGFLRLQSHVLKKLPISERLAGNGRTRSHRTSGRTPSEEQS